MRSLMMSFCMPMKRSPRVRNPRAADQGALVGRRIWFKLFFFELGQNEIINRGFWPIGVLNFRHRGFFDGLPGPMLFVGIFPVFLRGGSDAGIRSAHLYPGFEIG